MSGEGASPLIVTAALPPALHRRFTALRTAHFPPERNHLEAHVTLFHALPPRAEGEVRSTLAALCREAPPPPGRVEGLMSLGRGVAVRLASAALLALRDELAARFHGLLTAQDSHRPRLHVTIQNKVTPAEAKSLLSALAPTILPETFAFTALRLHAYRGGPWEHLQDYPFRGQA